MYTCSGGEGGSSVFVVSVVPDVPEVPVVCVVPVVASPPVAVVVPAVPPVVADVPCEGVVSAGVLPHATMPASIASASTRANILMIFFIVFLREIYAFSKHNYLYIFYPIASFLSM